MTQSWQRLSPTERWLLISQTILISSSALAEAMTNEASRQFNSWLIRLDCLVIPVGRVIPHVDWLSLVINTENDNILFGLHVDASKLHELLGFGLSTPSRRCTCYVPALRLSEGQE